LARIRLLSLSGPPVAETSVDQSGETIISNLPPATYVVEGSAPGFVTVRETVAIELKWSSATVFLVLKPEDPRNLAPAGLAPPLLTPKARKELEKGLEAFRRKDISEARKHFEKALAMAPGNPDVQYLMGVLELQEKNIPAAQEHLEKAIQLYPNHVRALELLGEFYCTQGHPRQAVPLLEKAVSLEGGSWKAHWKLGSAYLQANEAEKAREQAERAIALGKTDAGVAQVLKAGALVELGKSGDAEIVLAAFVRDQPNDPAWGDARALLARLQQRQNSGLKETLPLDTRTSFTTVAELRPELPRSKNSAWAPPGIDDFVPAVASNVGCALPKVLAGAGQRVEQLMANLEKFSATERIDHFAVSKLGDLRSPETRSFDYVVMVLQKPLGVIELDEYRNGSLDPHLFPASVATEGLPSMALVFHPTMVSGFDFVCEGLGQAAGRPAWQVHFQQRAGRPNRIRAYVIGGNYHPVALKGRAWIDAGTYQVVRLETELVKPMPEIHLLREHLSIDYAPVQFHSKDVQLWLPASAQLLVVKNNLAFYRTHAFSNFQIFSVGAGQKVGAPKESYSFTNLSDQDVRGKLTITPMTGHSLAPVSITFTIPPRQVVLKAVGPGKDLNIPPESIESARFVYEGVPGVIQADALLTRPSTIEIVPESPVAAGEKN
jgi:tetratricopeptide (TPR) repeat protein